MKKVFILLVLSLTFIACAMKVEALQTSIFIDFENESNVDSLFNRFEGSIVKEAPFSGSKCAQLDNVSNAVELRLSVSENKIYKVSYWRKGPANLSAVLKSKDHSIRLKEKVGNKLERGWEKVELLVNSVWCKGQSELIIQIKPRKKVTTFIDDMKVEEIALDEAEYNFTVPEKELSKVVELRNKAYKSPYVLPKYKKYVKGDLNGTKVSFKLKGDWKDHIETGIWSFKTKGAKALHSDAKTITFQNLKTRNFLAEWVFINLCKRANIVTPNYEVVTVSVNNSSPYVCALEESFSNDFILRKTGFDAPVLRLYEDFLFPHWVRRWGDKTLELPELENSFIYPYDPAKYESTNQTKRFNQHAEKLRSLIKEDSIIHLIDIQKWADFYAIQRLTKAYHNLTWHNTRWFVNEAGLIEPIAYDGNTQNGETETWFGDSKFGVLDAYMEKAPTVAINFMNKLFMNDSFMKAYKASLTKYSDASFLKKEVEALSVDLSTSLLKVQQFYDYDFSTEYLFTSAKKIKPSIASIDNSKWIGKEDVFNSSIKKGKIPKDKMYLTNLVRGYYLDGNITFVNGVNDVVIIKRKGTDKEIEIAPNSVFKVEGNIKDNWITTFEGEKIELDIVPWIPIY